MFSEVTVLGFLWSKWGCFSQGLLCLLFLGCLSIIMFQRVCCEWLKTSLGGAVLHMLLFFCIPMGRPVTNWRSGVFHKKKTKRKKNNSTDTLFFFEIFILKNESGSCNCFTFQSWRGLLSPSPTSAVENSCSCVVCHQRSTVILLV